MARRRSTPQYLIQEPTTGLYAALAARGARLTYAAGATRFDTAAAALVAVSAAGLTEQPHELVRVDA